MERSEKQESDWMKAKKCAIQIPEQQKSLTSVISP